ncbi:MAG: twin-arginine translocase TatA/TatE family subunit [Gemmatimonadetes bacterium]|nr:twin-arginine translocase TatA/TatE family subunit [Gemmatimonadota bacterium]
MGIGNLGFGEIMVIMLVVLLVFGAKRLPEVGASIGKGIREFKRSITETNDAITEKDDAPPRQLDSEPPSSDGEPKRLSQ